ncbi:MAG: MarR family transcriptional regulator [Anaerolineales bacterium]
MAIPYTDLRERKHPYRLMHDVYVQLDYGDRVVLNHYGLTTTQYRLLNLIDPAKGLRLTKLSERLLRSKSQITRTIVALGQMGLVRSLHDGSDGRAQLVTLTRKGEKLRNQANKEHAISLQARFSFLTTSERKTLVGLLDKLQHGMAKYLEVE